MNDHKIKIWYGVHNIPLSTALKKLTNGAIEAGYCDVQTIIDLRNACKKLLKENKFLHKRVNSLILR